VYAVSISPGDIIMNIQDLSQKTGVSDKTIRYYEGIGLLPLAHRQPNGYREYFEPDIERLRLVAGARRLDLSLSEIREILDMRDDGEAPCITLLARLAAKADEIAERIKALQRLENDLRELHTLGLTFPTDDVEGKSCVCHLVSHPEQ
jgi:DNA-binding transcriptional MerR regulator